MKTKALVPLLLFALSAALAFALSTLVLKAPVAQAASGGLQLRAAVDETRVLSESEREEFLGRILPKLGSGMVASRLAKRLGATSAMSKFLKVPEKKGDGYRAALDQPVDSDPVGTQNEPSIAASPIDESIVVAVAHNDFNFSGYTNACSIYLSFDGGVSYFYFDDLPLLDPTDFCSDPVVRFSPDGNTVYYNYLSVRADTSSSDIVVATAPGFAPDLVGLATVVIAGGFDFPDKNWLEVHTFDSGDGVVDGGGYVYVSGTVFFANGDCGIIVNRSANYGLTWDYGAAGSVLFNSPGCSPVVQGSRPAGGPGQQVLVCYYHSETDGFRLNRFDIKCLSSADRLTSISAPITAANNVPYELSEWLGPTANYHRWWGGMFPSIAIDHRGVAHVAFTVDPTLNQLDAESGNVQYMRSTASATIPPYTTWTARVGIGTGGRAQGYPTVVAQRSNTQVAPNIYIAYVDHYRSLASAPNRVYDVRYRKSTNGGATFGYPVRVTDVSSLSDWVFIGDYIDSAATMRRYHLVWTDRADKLDIFDPEDDVFADRF